MRREKGEDEGGGFECVWRSRVEKPGGSTKTDARVEIRSHRRPHLRDFRNPPIDAIAGIFQQIAFSLKSLAGELRVVGRVKKGGVHGERFLVLRGLEQEEGEQARAGRRDCMEGGSEGGLFCVAEMCSTRRPANVSHAPGILST